MKTNELIKRLKEAGCYIVSHGGRHDMWYSPKTKKKSAIPRHGSQELHTGTAKSIIKALLGE